MKPLLVFFLSLLGLCDLAMARNQPLPGDLSAETLAGILIDAYKPHEGVPLGVPKSYDWAKRPRMGAGNNPNGFLAATGWAQVFYNHNSPLNNPLKPSRIAIRRLQTFICAQSSEGFQWSLVQEGEIEGRQFRADFTNNASQSAAVFQQTSEHAEIEFARGAAFHFWPRAGRFTLPDQSHCGILVILQAKQLDGDANNLVVGLGADYWTTPTAAWDNYKTNKDLAIGRLKVLGPDWRWVGMTTAQVDALSALRQQGYSRPSNHRSP